jgi:hypothetical protein
MGKSELDLEDFQAAENLIVDMVLRTVLVRIPDAVHQGVA